MRFEIYRDKKKEYRWRLVAKNGKTIADSGEGYKRRAGCMKAISSLRIKVSGAEVVEIG